MARRLISRYPFTAFLTAVLDFANAGGSKITTSNCSFLRSSSGSSSNTSAQRNCTVSPSPFNAAFWIACATASSEASTPSTLHAPAIPALSANEPVWVKQSSTFAFLQSLCIASRLYFWSRKKPVFCPSFTSTRYCTPFSVIGTMVSNGSPINPFSRSIPSFKRTFASLLS